MNDLKSFANGNGPILGPSNEGDVCDIRQEQEHWWRYA